MKPKIRIFLLITGFLLLFAPVGLDAQTPYYEYLTIHEGLPSQTVYQSFQDKQGYMWFATDQGVSRYDGYAFRNFNMKDGLPDNEIMQIWQDKTGRIWLLSLNGKISYYFQNKFYNSENDKRLSKVPNGSGHLTSFSEDKDGTVYLSSHNGDLFEIPKEGDIKKSTIPGSIFYMWIYQGHIYLVRDNGLWCYKDRNIHGTPVKIHTLQRYSHPTKVFVYGNTVLISYDRTIEFFDLKSNRLIHSCELKVPNVEINYSFIDSKGKVWLGTRSGIFKAESVEAAINGKWIHILNSVLISFIKEDNEKNIWISSMGKGIFLVPNPDILWLSHTYPALQNTTASCLLMDKKGQLWVGLDKNNYAIITGDSCKVHLLNPAAISGKLMRIRQIGDSVCLIGKSNIGISHNGSMTLLRNTGNDFLLDGQDRYWLAFHQAAAVEKSEVKESLAKAITQSKKVVLDKRSNVLYEDPNGGIWVGTFEGLYHYNGKSFEDFGKRWPLLKGKINDIESNPANGNLLVGTDNYGVVEINIQQKKIVPDSKFRQLGMISCFSITNQGSYCWLGTNKGIILVNPSPEFKVYYYSELLGLRNLHVSDIAVADNGLYATTSNGLLLFDKIAVEDIRVTPPPIYITTVSNKIGEVDPSKDHVFRYAENEMIINFKGLSYKGKGDLVYRYRLDGIDKDFRTTPSREVVLKALPAGEYTFLVYALNKSGQMSEEPARFHFRILKPMWQQWWFILSAIGLCILIISVFWRLRLSIVRRGYELEKARVDEEKKRLEVENKLVELEQHAMRLQMNPHFIFNALNSIKGYYAEKKIAEADEYISRFSKILRHILENSERYSSLQDEINILELYLEMAQMRYPEKFVYHIEIAPEVNTNDLSIPCMLLQPFVENAIMHGIAPKQTKGLITISFYIENEHLICKIFDDGMGVSKSKEMKVNKAHHSKAIEITKKRLDYISEHEGIECLLTIEDSCGPDGKINGTLVFISLPTKKLW